MEVRLGEAVGDSGVRIVYSSTGHVGWLRPGATATEFSFSAPSTPFSDFGKLVFLDHQLVVTKNDGATTELSRKEWEPDICRAIHWLLGERYAVIVSGGRGLWYLEVDGWKFGERGGPGGDAALGARLCEAVDQAEPETDRAMIRDGDDKAVVVLRHWRRKPDMLRAKRAAEAILDAPKPITARVQLRVRRGVEEERCHG